MSNPQPIDYRVFVPVNIACAMAFAYLAYTSHQPQGISVPQFTAICFFCAGCALGIVLYCSRVGRTIPLTWIIGSALIFRGIGVMGYPLFEDDFYRYMWDGYRTATTLDPYSLAPAHFFGLDHVPEQFEDVLSGINYPDIATIYGPVCQWIFAAAYLISPASIWPLQLIMAIADVLVLLLLCTMTRGTALLLYAWSPLLIKEFAMTAHPDIAAIALAVLAVYAYRRSWFFGVGVALGLAVGVKVFAILLLPFLLFRQHLIREGLMTMAALSITLLITTWVYGTPRVWYPEGLQAMAESWIFNAPVYYFLNPWSSFTAAKMMMLGIFLLISGSWVLSIWYWRFRQSSLSRTVSMPDGLQKPGAMAWWIRKHTKPDQYVIPRGDWLYGFFLICIPVLNPWYLPWLLPFAVIYPSRWVWVASSSILLAYWSGLYTADSSLELHGISTSVLLIEFGVVAAMLVWDWLRPLEIKHTHEETALATQ